MKVNKIIALLFITILSNICILSTKAEQYLFTKLSTKSLPISTTNYIYKGSDKYIWLATSKGVFRFDGYEYKKYTYENTVNAVPGNDVYGLFRDSISNFWVLTDKGVGLYNYETDSFESIKDETLGKNPIFSFCLDWDGVYLGGINKIYKYTYATRKVSLYKAVDGQDIIYFESLYKIADNKILYYTNNKVGIFYLDDKTIEKEFLSFPAVISSLYVDSKSKIWVSSYNMGLKCYDFEGKELGTYNKKNSRLSNDVILCMAEQQDSLLWIGTEGGGINIFNNKTGNISVIEHTIGDDKSLPSNSINCLFADGANTMWAGSIRDGVISIKRSAIKTYTEASVGSTYGLSNSTILHLLEDKEEECVWIGTDGEGVNKFDLKKRSFTHYPATLKTKVVSIAQYSDNELLLSLYLKGLYLFNKKTGRIRPAEVQNKQIKEALLYTGTVIHLFNETEDDLLISGFNLFRYNQTKRTSEFIRFKGKDLSDGYLFQLGQDRNYTYYHDNHSIYRLKIRGNELETVFTLSDANRINSAAVDNNNTFWLGTRQGLAFYSPAEQKYRNLPTKMFDDIMLVVPDNIGKVWIGANSKLYAYQIEENSFALFGESDGVLNNEYIRKSRLLTSQGDVLMGGNKGLLAIDHSFTINQTEDPRIILTDVWINNSQIKGISEKGKSTIRIPSENKMLELQVMAIEKDLLRPKIYRYEITGANHLKFESYAPKLTLESLLPGRNSIYVSCSTRKGEWTAPVKVLVVDVLPIWYDTLWFKLTILILAIVFSASIFYFIFHLKENKLRMELQKQEKDIYEEKVRFLININHELRTPLTLIHAPLKRILNEMKTSDTYYTKLSKIYRQSSRMKKLLNMVLDLRKMEVGEKKMEIGSYKVNDWIDAIISDFIDEGEAMGIEITTDLDSDIDFINFDKEKCDIIITNMLVNAIKHSKKGDNITISTQRTIEGMIRISVKDQGTGFTDIDPQKLFTRFYQGNNEEYGSGIGLAYSKVLVELHQGRIGAYNNEEGGATFFFELPVNLAVGRSKCEISPYLNRLFTPEKQAVKILTDKENIDFDTSKNSILIVDDSRELTDFIVEAFKDKFMNIYVAPNGEEALNIIMKKQPSIIVSDVMMPLMDGYELCKAVKSNVEFSHIPVILLTAQNEELSEQTGYKLGADAFLDKPFEMETLYELIKNKLRSREDIKNKYIQMSVLPEPNKDTFSLADESFLQKLNNIIKENINNPELDITLLCSGMGMSRASLYNKLKALTNMSGNEYVNKVKMEKAIQLIKSSDMSFTQIANETGFTSLKYFSSAFKLYTGMTPTKFKKDLNENNKEEKSSDDNITEA